MASAAMNSSVLASCNYAAISGSGSAAISELSPKTTMMMMKQPAASSKFPQRQRSIITAAATTNTATTTATASSRRAALLFLTATAFTTASNSIANAGVIDDYLEKSKANKELNDKKRLATSGANFARAFTVQFGSCKFPENFTGCQDLAKQKKVPFISDDLSLECQGKDKYKCGSNVFWKW